jgi:drug/metabolite transporter (DMT)-like permease
VKFLAVALRMWSCAFSLFTGLFLTGLGILIVTTNIHNLNMTMLPWWKDTTLTVMLFVLGLSGILASVLAALKRIKPLLVVYTLIAFGVIVDGFFINPTHRFDGKAGFISAAWLALAALVAFAGSFAQFCKQDRA